MVYFLDSVLLASLRLMYRVLRQNAIGAIKPLEKVQNIMLNDIISKDLV
jgi:hypothetical protein